MLVASPSVENRCDRIEMVPYSFCVKDTNCPCNAIVKYRMCNPPSLLTDRSNYPTLTTPTTARLYWRIEHNAYHASQKNVI